MIIYDMIKNNNNILDPNKVSWNRNIEILWPL